MPQPNMEVKNIPLRDIFVDDEWNCRGPIAPYDVADLAQDIDQRGLLQPVIVAPYDHRMFKYKLIAGYRRTCAHKVLRLTAIPAIIRPELVDELEARVINGSENIQRSQLNVLQEAKLVQQIGSLGLSEEEVGRKLGMSRGWVQVRNMLLRLPEGIQKQAAAGLINQKQIRHLYTLNKQARATGDSKPVYDAVQAIIKAREKGKTIDVNPHKRTVHSKRHRKRGELFNMIDHVLDTIGPGLHTRILAWAAGELTSRDLHKALQIYADENHMHYEPPEDYEKYL